ncbi:MAG: hypothetical protein RLZZ450_7461 [Pseudomonadota bacterium]|jgi:hypothetical protein
MTIPCEMNPSHLPATRRVQFWHRDAGAYSRIGRWTMNVCERCGTSAAHDLQRTEGLVECRVLGSARIAHEE